MSILAVHRVKSVTLAGRDQGHAEPRSSPEERGDEAEDAGRVGPHVKGAPMGFLNANQAHIFISYAYVDNHPFTGHAAGWVTTLVEHLKNLLDRRFGRRDNYSLWMDPRLTGNEPFSPAIEAA